MKGEETFEEYGSYVAVIGMAGRFPAARDVRQFWENLKNGVEGISFFADDEMEVEVSPEDLRNPNFVRAKGILEEVELFDASFFQITAREAQWMDPQQRLFLECAWNALEDAGYDVSTYEGAVAVYAGVDSNSYLLARLAQLGAAKSAEVFGLLLANEKDHLATRVSYKLNLRGESITVQTACSTSLVAAHLAYQSLLSGQCDMALAGGVSIRDPQKVGYFYEEGMVMSPDGHCRPFDRRAKGTVTGHGLGIVVLKLLSEALSDGDHIYAVIKGSAINNDGRVKVGYTAPSVEGQTDVIVKALAMAGVEADSIGYVEAHGTGTQLGDPIEVEALTRAFRRQTERKNFCTLGAVKSNVGHLNNAAGVAGLIKTALALKHGQIPPTLHFEEPNPLLDLATSPFVVRNTLREWKRDGAPRRAGLSCFGIGGTNVHMILEEAPARIAPPSQRTHQILTLSAKTPEALSRMACALASRLEDEAGIDLADAAYTLNVGRQAFAHRHYVVARSATEAAAQLRAQPPQDVSQKGSTQAHGVVFMFPGQGSQHAWMAKELYESEPEFRRHVEECAGLLRPLMDSDLLELIYPQTELPAAAGERLAQPAVTLPALFTIEYALARLWMSWGVVARALIGHSFGEYAAACVAGVFSLEDGLRLAVERGRLMQQLPEGAMTAVRLSETDVLPHLGERLSVSAVNSNSSCTVTGPVEEIAGLERRLAEERVGYRRLEVPFAYHSSMIEAILPEFTAVVSTVALKAPSIPYVSSLSGDWIREEEATDPLYWAQQMRRPVRFARGLDTLAEREMNVFLEVGPGQTLCALSKQHFGRGRGLLFVPSLAAPQSKSSDSAVCLDTLGQLWRGGHGVSWRGFYASERRMRLPLPTYSFDRQRYWVDIVSTQSIAPSAPQAVRELFADDEQTTGDGLDARSLSNGRQAVRRTGQLEEYLAPRNEIEEALAEVWGDVLGYSGIGVRDNFFDLGGDSLVATQVFSRIKQSFAVNLSLEQMLAHQTIADFSKAIQSRIRAEEFPQEPEARDDFYCAFESRLGDEEFTVLMTEDAYRLHGLPQGSENFRLIAN